VSSGRRKIDIGNHAYITSDCFNVNFNHADLM
jgi:hypothetical protein